MECPNCHKVSEEGNKFCISCGTPLAPLQEEHSAELTDPVEVASVDLQTLHNELRRLHDGLAQMNRRVVALERSQSASIPATHRLEGPAPGVQGRMPPNVPPPEGEDILGRVREWDWERILGGNWLARVGVFALIIGVAFFLKLAFDNDWIGPTGRVVLGIVGGLALLGAGQFWWKKYPAYSQAITGGGIALLYLSFFAAFAIYSLIDIYSATALLLMVSVASAALSLQHESKSLAIIGILGAFSAPFILGGFDPEARGVVRTGQNIQLLAYIIGVDLGVLVLSTFRNWRWLTLLALIGSLAAYGGWFTEFGDNASLLITQGGLTLIFLIFVSATTLFHVIWRRAPRALDQSLMVLNAAAYFGISYGLLWDDFRLWMGGFSLAMSLFYGGLAYLALRRSAENVGLSFFALGIALVFLTIAVPVQLGDKAWTTIVWAAEGAILLWISFHLRMPQIRYFGYAIFAITAIRLVFFDTPVDVATFRSIVNERFLAFLVGIGVMYLSAYMVNRNKDTLMEWEKGKSSVYGVFLVAANVLMLWILTAEVIAYFDARISDLGRPDRFGAVGSGLRNAQNLSLTALWAVYALILTAIGIAKGSKPVRIAALALLTIPIAKVFVYDVFTLERIYRVVAFMGLGALLLIGGYLYQRYSRKIKGFILAK